MGEIRAVTRAMPPRKARRDVSASDAAAAAGTHIFSLGDDLLLEIFLRLPSLATLVRAAYTCRPWLLAVASSPAFRRRFRGIHKPPLLGLYHDSQDVPRFPAFVPVRIQNRDQAAAVRSGDFFLTSLQDRRRWKTAGCCRGSILLVNLDAKLLAVLNPLNRQRDRVIDHVPKGIFRSYQKFNDIGIFCSDDDPSSFRVTFPAFHGSRIKVTVFSSDTGVWSVTPSVDFPVDPGYYRQHLNAFSVHENGLLYWIHGDLGYIISLDTATMEFSMAKLPRCEIRTFVVSETKDGAACIVYTDGSYVGLL